jgi:hypothetical protein
MYKQHTVCKIEASKKASLLEVKCEKSGTIYYTDGKKISWTKEALLKSASYLQNSVFEEDKQTK